jgi:hypothetical protein
MKQCSRTFPISLLLVHPGEGTGSRPLHRKDIDALIMASMLFRRPKAGSDRHAITYC